MPPTSSPSTTRGGRSCHDDRRVGRREVRADAEQRNVGERVPDDRAGADPRRPDEQADEHREEQEHDRACDRECRARRRGDADRVALSDRTRGDDHLPPVLYLRSRRAGRSRRSAGPQREAMSSFTATTPPSATAVIGSSPGRASSFVTVWPQQTVSASTISSGLAETMYSWRASG